MKALAQSFLTLSLLFLISCNPLAPSPTVSAQYNPGYDSTCAPTQTDNTGTAKGFGGGTSNGAAWDASNGYVRLSNSGGCDGTRSNCNSDDELGANWTPGWSNVVAYLKLNETSGTMFADSSGHNNNAAMETGVPGFVPGKLMGAVSFNGASNAAIPNSASLNLSTAWTVQVWVNQQGAPSSNSAMIVGDEYGGHVQFCLGYCQSVGVSAMLTTNGTIFNSPTYNLTNGTWTHLVGVYSGSAGTLTLYVNGTLVGVTTSVASTAITDGLPKRIARRWDNPDYFDGYIDEIAIWNTALTSNQIQSIYNRQSARYAGTFTSRVMDGLSNSANWTNFSWTPTLPFFKELPDSTDPANPKSEIQANYSSQSSNLMNGIVGLWHLDEAAGTTSSNSVLDKSGNEYNGTPTGVTFGASGKFGTSASINGGQIDVGDVLAFSGTASFSSSVWFQTSVTSGYANLAGNRGSDGNGLEGWLMFVVGATGQMVFTRTVGSQQYYALCTTAVNDGSWHHAVMTYDGANIRAYLDGILVDTSADSHSIPVITNDFYIGLGFSGSIDEVSVWNRPLTDGSAGSPNEILELYRRGANRIKYQVRTCADSTCSTNPTWLGPDNSNQTYFSELNNTLANALSGTVQSILPTMLFSNFTSPSLNVGSGRYFQYRTIMESDDTGNKCDYGSGATWCSPELKAVSVSKSCP